MATAWFAAPGMMSIPYARQSGEVIIELNKRSPPPPPPYELLGAVSEETYSSRMQTLHRTMMRYSWGIAERIYLFVACAVTFILPWPLLLLVDDTFGRIDTTNNPTDGFGNIILTDSQVSHLRNARLITFGIILSSYLLLWTPYFLFKHLGLRRRTALLTSWTNADCSPPRPQHQHLGWRVKSCSTMTGRAQIVVTLPMHAWGQKPGSMSNFHPDAYLPAYLAPAEKGGFPGSGGQYAPPAGPPPGQQYGSDEKV